MLLENNNVLITGINSGLGAYLYRNVANAFGLTRENKGEVLRACSRVSDLTIIHCAFNPRLTPANVYEYVSDNLFLTKELLFVPHKKFIYISSVGVYETYASPYGLTKQFAEATVANESSNFLILRAPALLGPTMRSNSLIKIIEGGEEPLSLSSESSFNYVLQSDILEIIKTSIDQDVKGIYNCVTSKNVTLAEVAEKYNKTPAFGEYKYATPEISNAEISKLFPLLKRTSLETIEQYIKERDE